MFMTFVVATYIIWVSTAHGGPVGGGLPMNVSYAIAAGLSVIIAVAVYFHGKRLKLD